MKPQTNTENATIANVGKQLTQAQVRTIINTRAAHWNEPLSLWKPIVFAKEKQKPAKTTKVAEVSKPVVKKK